MRNIGSKRLVIYVMHEVRLAPLLTGPKDHSAQPRLGTPNTIYILILGHVRCAART